MDMVRVDVGGIQVLKRVAVGFSASWWCSCARPSTSRRRYAAGPSFAAVAGVDVVGIQEVLNGVEGIQEVFKRMARCIEAAFRCKTFLRLLGEGDVDSIQEVFERVAKHIAAAFRCKAFLRWLVRVDVDSIQEVFKRDAKM